MERTLVIIKPDGVSRGLIGEIIKRYEQKGLKPTYMQLITADKETVEEHYREHKGKSFYDNLVSFMASGPILLMVIEGENVIELVRKVNGATKASEAAPGTIRGDFASNTTYNVVHGSDSVENAEREIALWIK